MRSLKARLLFSSTIVLTVFLLILAIALDHSFRTQKINDIAARLNIFVQSVIAQIEIKDKYSLCKNLSFIGDAGFSKRKNASLFGVIINKHALLWQSTSNRKSNEIVPYIRASRLGKLIQKIKKSPDGRSFLSVSYRVSLPVVDCDAMEPEIPLSVNPPLNQPQINKKAKDKTGDKTRDKKTVGPKEPSRPGQSGIPPTALPQPSKPNAAPPANGQQLPPVQPYDSQNDLVEIVIKISEALDAPHERFEEQQDTADDEATSSGEPENSKADNNSDDTKFVIFEGPENKPEVLYINPIVNQWNDIDIPNTPVNQNGAYTDPPTIEEGKSEQRTYYDDLYQFRITLAFGLTAVLGIYLLLFMVFLRLWGLMPMRKVSEELEQIKTGEAEKLSGVYPEEISGLTDSINRLIITERAQQERYRNSLGDLAHSLKTPLAVLVGAGEQEGLPEGFKQDMQVQVARMRQIVDYQLQRAAAGRASLSASVPVAKSLQRLANTLFKAYADKNVKYSQDIDESVMFRGDEGDFLEMFGNLMENAFKWCADEVKVSAWPITDSDNFRLSIQVEDNGPGVPEDKIESVLTRGFRADEAVSGQGIGLSVVKEIIHAYKGKLEISRSDMGGARFRVLV